MILWFQNGQVVSLPKGKGVRVVSCVDPFLDILCLCCTALPAEYSRRHCNTRVRCTQVGEDVWFRTAGSDPPHTRLPLREPAISAQDACYTPPSTVACP